DMTTWEKVLGMTETGVDMGAKAADIGYRGKEISNKIHDTSPGVVDGVQHVDKVLAGFGGAAGVLMTVSSGIKVMKKTTKLIQRVIRDDKYSKTEYGRVAGDILSNTAKAALGVVNTIKVIHYALGNGTMIMQAVPILGIIINGMRAIMDGFYLIQSSI